MKVTAHRKTSQSALKTSKGFTLVELLIVIAVIGVLAAVILAVINPLQQLARGRDAGRTSTIAQLGSALQRYATSNTDYPVVPASGNGTFMTDLVTANEIQATFTNPDYGGTLTAGCETTQNNQGEYCYDADATTNDAIVYARAESDANNDLCDTGEIGWIVWSSAAGRSGIVCTASNAFPPLTGITFEN